MTLIRCPECKKQISDIAQQCPYCGCCDFTPKPKKKISKKKLLFLLLFPIVMANIAIYAQNTQSSSYSQTSVRNQNTISQSQNNLPEAVTNVPDKTDAATFEDMGL